MDESPAEERRRLPAHVVVDGVKVGWGDKFVDVRGPLTIWAIGVLAVLTTVLYGVYRVEHAVEKHHEQMVALQEHNRLVYESLETARRDESAAFRRRMDIQNCISMFSFDERRAIRMQPRSFMEVCPWIEPDPIARRRDQDYTR